MKKVIIILTLSMGLQGMSQNFTRITKDGSETGYYSSTIHIDNLGNSTFLYDGPGYTEAFIAYAPVPDMIYSYTLQERAVNFALDQIEAGKLRGSRIVLGENGKLFKLRWKADRRNTKNTKITMRPIRSKALVE